MWEIECKHCGKVFEFEVAFWDIDECPNCKKGFYVSVEYLEDIDEEFPIIDWDE